MVYEADRIKLCMGKESIADIFARGCLGDLENDSTSWEAA